MYEDMTYDVIMKRMINAVLQNNPGLDTREGSVIWFALSPAAIELQNAYLQLDIVLNETFADTASRPRLILRCEERGITPYPATSAVYTGTFTPSSLDIPIGSRFSSDTLVYQVSEKEGDGTYRLTCETAGTVGNNDVGTILPVNYIEGLETAKLIELIIPGEDEESTDALRKRYFDSLDAQSFGGNVADYKERVNAMNGVGGVKVYPVWNGGGTVKLVIINSEFNVPSAELVGQVQTAVDPVQNSGRGVGIAPIGHVVTVQGVTGMTINIEAEITYQEGWSWDDVKTYAQDAIDGYFRSLSATWESEQNPLIVRISQIEAQLLSCPGVLDVTGTTLNGQAANVALAVDSIPVRGTVNG